MSLPQPETPSDPQLDQKAETRRRILAAAREVFLRDGFTAANLNEVSELAKVGKGTLYRHFDSKNELYVATLSEHGDRFHAELVEAIDPDADSLKQIEQITVFYLGFWERHPEHFRLTQVVQTRDVVEDLSPELRADLRRIFETSLRFLEAILARGIERGEIRSCDPWNTANAIMFLGNSLVNPIVGKVPQMVDRDMRAVYAAAARLILAGLTPV